jgi:SAM-dependent methyltransferase
VARELHRGQNLDGGRFGFGENWRKFNAVLTDDQRAAARHSLEEWLGGLEGLTFLDIGAGSGLFAAAAAELGADVTAFDFDPVGEWIERGDVLDRAYMQSLGEFDVVYAWGVLHHTGDMWAALGNACDVVAAGGRLFVSIYNDQGWRSSGWRGVKRTYGRVPVRLRPLYAALTIAPFEVLAAAKATVRGRNYLSTWRRPKGRGMTKWRDVVDWIGGYPFQVARPEEVFDFCRARGFQLERMRTHGGATSCNEFVFKRLS